MWSTKPPAAWSQEKTTYLKYVRGRSKPSNLNAVDSNRTGCGSEKLCTAKQDFKEQKGRLQEELESHGQLIIFYPKFHCELNSIEQYWNARENCQYSTLRKTAPSAFSFLSSCPPALSELHAVARQVTAKEAAVQQPPPSIPVRPRLRSCPGCAVRFQAAADPATMLLQGSCARRLALFPAQPTAFQILLS